MPGFDRLTVETEQPFAGLPGCTNLVKRGPAGVMEHIPAGSHCYLAIDFDVIDPSEMPAVGAPTPGGLRYAEVVELIHQLARSTHLIGANLVELAPEQNVHDLGTIAAMRVVWNVIGALVRAQGAAKNDLRTPAIPPNDRIDSSFRSFVIKSNIISKA